MSDKFQPCPNCQKQVQKLSYCPHCGCQLDASPIDKKSEKRARRRAFTRRWILPIVLLLVVIAFGILGLALKGFRDGTAEQLLRKRHQADIHYNRGLVWLQVGQPEMAEAEFQETLRLVADYPDAAAQIQTAQVQQTVTPTPAATTTAASTRTPLVPTPTTQVIVIPATEILFKEAQAHYKNQEWEEAISKLTQIRELDGTFNADQVVEMLFQSHYRYATELDKQGILEDAIAHYDAALHIRPRVQEIEDLRRWADLYSRALGVWEVDWERVITNLTSIYLQNPTYKDVPNRLYMACITQAQIMADQQRWCAASELYEQALKVHNQDASLTEQERQERQIESVTELETKIGHLCDTAGTLPKETPSAAGEWPPPGVVSTGTLFATCYDYQTDQSSICFQNAVDNTFSTWITQTEQPALTLNGALLAYRSTAPEHPGLYAIDTAAHGLVISGSAAITTSLLISRNEIITITTNAQAHYPTWSPDGAQVAYTAYDDEKENWFIYIVDMTHPGAPQRIHQGEWPSWGPTGLLAFTGCNGDNSCGIYLYDPDQRTFTRLTASSQDKAPTWSPTGRTLVYMSDVGGISSNLYAVNTDGYVWQITQNISTDAVPVWSPDEQTIAYVTNHRNDWTIYTTLPKGDYLQKTRIAIVGAESADWPKFRLQWIAPVVRLADRP